MADQKVKDSVKGNYRLRDTTTSFIDDQTRLEVTRTQIVHIDDSNAGKKTLAMIKRGGLIRVSEEPQPPTGFSPNAIAEAPSAAASSGEEDELTEDFPHRDLLSAGGYTTLTSVRDASDEDLLKVEGIGDGRLKEIRKAVK